MIKSLIFWKTFGTYTVIVHFLKRKWEEYATLNLKLDLDHVEFSTVSPILTDTSIEKKTCIWRSLDTADSQMSISCIKYNNTNHSIPAHPTFVNDAHRGLRLWPVTSKINRVHPLTKADMSAKFDKEANNGLVSIIFKSLFPYMWIVTLTFDIWPPKSIGPILSLWLTCLPSLMKKHTMV